MVQAFLAFGANLGNRLANLQGARTILEATPGIALTRRSSLYETQPVGGPAGQADYLNAVAAIETTLPARALLHLCQTIEARFGRQRQEKWGARTLDLDLLCHGDTILQDPDLIVPHPELHRRAFVLLPLAEVAPELRHPALGQTVDELLAALADRGGVRRLAAEW